MWGGISEKVALRCSKYFFDHSKVRFTKNDGFVKSPTSVRHAHGPEQSRRAALRCILRHCELFTLPSNFDFLRDHQEWLPKKS